MKLKLDDDGHAVLDEGRPVYIREDGTEMVFDAAKSTAKIRELNAEAKAHREAKEAAYAKLEETDADKTAEHIKSLNAEAKGHREAKEAALAKLAAAESKLGTQLIDAAFSGSKILAEQVAVPAGLIRAQFGSHFRVENDKVVAYDKSGNKITSKTAVGNDAEFDEAMQVLLDGYEHRDAILKGRPGGAVGNSGNGGGGSGTKVLTRGEFDRLSPSQKMTKMKGGYKVVEAA